MFDEMKKKILIVDDERDIVDLLKYNIKRGIRSLHCRQRQEAIEQMKLNPNLVLLDVMMPKRDGWEVAREIRSKKNLIILQ